MPSDQRNKLTQRKKPRKAPHTASQAMQHAKIEALPLIRAAVTTEWTAGIKAELDTLTRNLLREQRPEFREWCATKANTIDGYLKEDAAQLKLESDYDDDGEYDDDVPSLEYTPEYWRHQQPEWDLRGFSDDEA
jgi:hypothetical protein